MKKLTAALVAVVGGLLVYRRIKSDRAEQDLWAEATDPIR